MSQESAIITKKDVEHAITGMETHAVNFGFRFIKDANVRAMYLEKTKTMSNELLAAYKSGVLTPKQAAETANKMRNEIMEFARVKSSDIGRAKAASLKTKGLDLDALTDKYAQTVYKKAFSKLTDAEKNQVYIGIVKSAGRANPRVSVRAARLGKVGKGLWILTACVAIYNVSVADNKLKAAGRETANIGGGFGGGAAGGAIAGIWFGPVGVAIGIIVGGTIGAIMADQVYVEVTGPDGDYASSLIPRFTNVVSTDEEGLARTLLEDCSYEMDKVFAVFVQLNDKYSTDADDIACLYVNKIKNKASPLVRTAFISHYKLRQYLISILEDGWTNAEEHQCIQYLRNLE